MLEGIWFSSKMSDFEQLNNGRLCATAMIQTNHSAAFVQKLYSIDRN